MEPRIVERGIDGIVPHGIDDCFACFEKPDASPELPVLVKGDEHPALLACDILTQRLRFVLPLFLRNAQVIGDRLSGDPHQRLSLFLADLLYHGITSH